MFRISKLLIALAVATVGLPLAAAETADAKKAAPDTSALPTQEQKIDATAKETRNLPPPKKMTAEEKKKDKAAKRIAPTKEEQEKANKAYSGG